jgi:hypothetical protein
MASQVCENNHPSLALLKFDAPVDKAGVAASAINPA